jgi:2-keto-4-pentenoate hydratase/2-oxohepta-3-ene-1,7-dioic acid hydratase in catechol pathway
MKLIRFPAASAGTVQTGIQLEDGTRLNTTAFGEDYDENFFGTNGPERLADWLTDHQHDCPVVPSGTPLLAPCARPSKLICVGLNYAAHAAESGAKPPTEPVLFMKATSAICGPNDDIVLPRGSEKTDWEVELAIVIGKRASYVDRENAMEHVAGYVLHNDVSERAFQIERGGQWTKGKGCDTFAPFGPFIATREEIPNPNDLRLWLKVNDEKVQDSRTNDFIFPVDEVVSYISQFMTLLPGDLISTGTPSGVGLGMDPPRYLKPGDVVELGIDGLGCSRQRVRAYDMSPS